MTTGLDEAVWKRFVYVMLAVTATGVIVSMTLSFTAIARVARAAEFTDWASVLFPLSLDLTVIVGYGGMIALHRLWAKNFSRGILVAAGAITIAAQGLDFAARTHLVGVERWVAVGLHSWPPVAAILCLHQLVIIVQSLGFLVPPGASASASASTATATAGASLGASAPATQGASEGASTATASEVGASESQGASVAPPPVPVRTQEETHPVRSTRDTATVEGFVLAVADAIVEDRDEQGSAKITSGTDDLEAKVLAVLAEVQKDGQTIVKDGVVSERKVQALVGGGRPKVKSVVAEVGRRLKVVEGEREGVGRGNEGGTPLHHDRVGPSDVSDVDPEVPHLRAVNRG